MEALDLRVGRRRGGFEVVSNLEKGGCGFGRGI
jgi:hypothetical protein